MKNAVLVSLLILVSLFSTQNAHAVENREFWNCAVAVAGFDFTVILAESTCAIAISAPTLPTVTACFGAVGVSAIAAAHAYLTCDEFLESQSCEEGPRSGNERTECSDSPILLDLDRNQFHLAGGPALFDIDSDGNVEAVTWVPPNSRDAFLFLDRNGNGVADNGLELFGTSTLLVNGDRAENGYEALTEFDLRENGGFEDGVIDELDSIFAELRVWIDDNADGVSEQGETMSLAEAGVLALETDYRESPRTDSFGNEFRYVGKGSILKNGKAKEMWTTDVFFKILAD